MKRLYHQSDSMEIEIKVMFENSDKTQFSNYLVSCSPQQIVDLFTNPVKDLSMHFVTIYFLSTNKTHTYLISKKEHDEIKEYLTRPDVIEYMESHPGKILSEYNQPNLPKPVASNAIKSLSLEEE